MNNIMLIEADSLSMHPTPTERLWPEHTAENLGMVYNCTAPHMGSYGLLNSEQTPLLPPNIDFVPLI
jgi:hypothetical protein